MMTFLIRLRPGATEGEYKADGMEVTSAGGLILYHRKPATAPARRHELAGADKETIHAFAPGTWVEARKAD